MLGIASPVPYRFLITLSVCVAVLAAATPAQATVPPGFTETLVAGGLSDPIAMAFAPDGRIFITEHAGNLRVIKDGALLPTPFVSISVDSTGERGLHGVALDPDFASNQYVYVHYTVPGPPAHDRVSRFTAVGDVAVEGSELVLEELDDLSDYTGHNGGAIHFGADGKLYVTTGENGDGANSQTLANRLGKMLRINADGSIPEDNPFYNDAQGDNRSIWALGLRNPFTFAFQPGTGRMFINDVGGSTWEEIDDGIAGSNYGWPESEGPTTDPRFRSPLFVYGHGGGPTTGCAITAGTFYNPASVQFPADYTGDYFFADLCSGWIRQFDVLTSVATEFAYGASWPVDLGVANDGSLYYLTLNPGALYRITATPTAFATLPSGFLESLVAYGLSGPTAMAFAPDGRLFVTEQDGALRVIKDGALLPTPFVSLSVDSVGEGGLLGIALDPAFATNQFLYVYYTVPGSPAHNRVSRFTAVGDVAGAGSERVMLELDDLSAVTGHYGGAIHFGSDGKLYVATGENGDGANSQTLANRLGKMLRINADGTIPEDNPFYNDAQGVNRSIWALGLRNPFTFAFQPGTGRMFINDVGGSTWEEIDDGIAGSNYGWPESEGPTTDPRFRSPLFAYGHGSDPTTGCAITGGAFYNPATVQFPVDYVGDYFFADVCSGWIRKFDPQAGTDVDFASGISQPLDLIVRDDGTLYYLTRGSGAVYRIGAPAQPTAVVVHSLRAKRSGQRVVFSWAAERNTEVLGFNVYRERIGKRVRVNRQWLPASVRNSYAFVDRSARPRDRYWLQVVRVDGRRSWFGPVAVNM